MGENFRMYHNHFDDRKVRRFLNEDALRSELKEAKDILVKVEPAIVGAYERELIYDFFRKTTGSTEGTPQDGVSQAKTNNDSYNESLVGEAIELLKRLRPDWEDDPNAHSGTVCCEMTWGDLRAINAFIEKAEESK